MVDLLRVGADELTSIAVDDFAFAPTSEILNLARFATSGFFFHFSRFSDGSESNP